MNDGFHQTDASAPGAAIRIFDTTAMSSHASLFVLGGCVLGAVQLLVGIAIGAWLRHANSAADRRGQQDMLQVSLIAKRLQALADEMSSSVGEHQTELNQAARMLTSDKARSQEALAERVVDVIGDIMRANQNLQSKLETAECRLQEQATEIETHISRSLTDPLTGLPNRREFDHRLEERMSAWNRRQEAFALLLIDVDHFKKLNDEHGHLAGDQVLAATGRALRDAIRREDSVARYGGEEFAILLPSTSLEQAARVAKNVREALAKVVVQHGAQRLTVTASCGLSIIQANEQAETLIGRADAALYAAKEAGRNCAFLHDGRECRPADPAHSGSQTAESPAARIVELINSPDLESQLAEDGQGEPASEFGSYLPREEISAELAKTCEELRRFLEERGERSQPGAARQASGVGDGCDA
jgi:diguanylate cyclase